MGCNYLPLGPKLSEGDNERKQSRWTSDNQDRKNAACRYFLHSC